MTRHCEERSDEAIQSGRAENLIWIASRSLSSGGACADPLTRNDRKDVDGRDIRAFTPVFDRLCPAMTT